VAEHPTLAELHADDTHVIRFFINLGWCERRVPAASVPAQEAAFTILGIPTATYLLCPCGVNPCIERESGLLWCRGCEQHHHPDLRCA
jgi:hypothetical protein